MKFLTLLSLSFLLVFASNAQRRTIDVSDFSELAFAVPGAIYLKQGNEVQVEVDCDDDIFEKLEFEVTGDRLSIRNKGKWRWNDGFRRSELDIYITMRSIEEISLSGSGTITGENQFDIRDLKLSISGSGNMDLDVSGDQIEAHISGSGNVNLNGSSERIKARISGSGKVNAEDMNTKVFKGSISGSGNCYVTASEEVEANISGSGNVYYSGNPSRVISNSSGSGKIRKQ